MGLWLCIGNTANDFIFSHHADILQEKELALGFGAGLNAGLQI
jgi:hypothetical protein